MAYVCKIAKPNEIGDPCSKYGYVGGSEQFIKDMQAHEERAKRLWDDFITFMKERNVDPRDMRTLFTRYYEEFLT